MSLEEYKNDKEVNLFIPAFIKGISVTLVFVLIVTLWLLFYAEDTVKSIRQNIDIKTIKIDIPITSKILPEKPLEIITDIEPLEYIYPIEPIEKLIEPELAIEPEIVELIPIKVQEPEVVELETIKEPVITQENSEEISIINAPLNETSKTIEIENHLYIETEFGNYSPVLVKEHNKKTIFSTMSKQSSVSKEIPRIALIYEEYGLSPTRDNKIFNDLSENITLLLSPNIGSADVFAVKARNLKHELWLDFPVDSYDYPQKDPGALVILLSNSMLENKIRLQKIMSTFPNYAGVIFTENAKLFEDINETRIITKYLMDRGIAIVSRQENDGIEIGKIADQNKSIIYNYVDKHIDRGLTLETIEKSLYELERIAEKKGYAIGIFKGTPATINKLKNWTSKLDEKGIKIVPLSSLVIEKRVE